MASVFLFVFFVLSHLVPLHSAQEEAGYSYTQRCPEFHCRNLRPLGFPFTSKSKPECGVFTIECGDQISTIQLEEGGRSYQVLSIYPDNTTMRIKDELIREQHPASVECDFLHNLTITSSSFVSFEFSPNQTFFKCKRTLNIPRPTNFKNINCKDHDIYYNGSSDSFPTSLSVCSIIQLPKNPNPDLVAVDGHPFGLLAIEFELKPNVSDACYRCYQRGGHCKPDDKGELDCLGAEKDSGKKNLKIAFGVVCPVIVFIMICVLFIIRRHYKKKYASSNMLARNANSDPSSRLDLGGGSLYYGVPVYSYSELEEATNNFDTEKELGDGGFGIV